MMKKWGYLIWITFGMVTSTLAQTDAEQFLKQRMNNPLLRTEENLTGEGVCWHAAYDMDRFMDRYRATSDPAWLDAAAKYYDALIQKLYVSPDGYRGWVGPYIYDEQTICDVHIGDAILINPMLDFAETILKGSSANQLQKYADHAREYVNLARRDLIEKWDARGTWHEDGPYGAYTSWDHYMTEDNLKEWRILPVTKSILSLPFNKQNAMGIASLRLYRITGDVTYRERALKIFNNMKSRMCLYQDHYVWNYWEPFGAWDIDPDRAHTLRHWVNVHPYRNYQALEIDQIAEAYQSGITFNREDIERIIHTNLKVMWNGDKEKPAWKNSNYAVEMASMGKVSITKAPGGEFPDLAGTLWRGLLDFDATIRELAKRNSSTPPSFDRKNTNLPVTELDFPFQNNCDLNLAVALPSHMTKDHPAYLISQSRVDGAMEIALYSSDGITRLAAIRKNHDQDPEGILIIPWDRKGIAPGNYRIRWTLKNAYREFPITIQ